MRYPRKILVNLRLFLCTGDKGGNGAYQLRAVKSSNKHQLKIKIYEQPLVSPQVLHLRQVPLRTKVKLPQALQASPS